MHKTGFFCVGAMSAASELDINLVFTSIFRLFPSKAEYGHLHVAEVRWIVREFL